MHIIIFWLQIVEFDVFYHSEQSLWIYICFQPFLFTCGTLPLMIIVVNLDPDLRRYTMKMPG